MRWMIKNKSCYKKRCLQNCSCNNRTLWGVSCITCFREGAAFRLSATDSNTSFGVSFCLFYAILVTGGVRITLANCINASKAYCEWRMLFKCPLLLLFSRGKKNLKWVKCSASCPATAGLWRKGESRQHSTLVFPCISFLEVTNYCCVQSQSESALHEEDLDRYLSEMWLLRYKFTWKVSWSVGKCSLLSVAFEPGR